MGKENKNLNEQPDLLNMGFAPGEKELGEMVGRVVNDPVMEWMMGLLEETLANPGRDLYEGLTPEEAEAQREWESYIDEVVMPKVRKFSIEFQREPPSEN